MSCYGAEDERLFIGGQGFYNSYAISGTYSKAGTLQFRTIRIVSEKKNHIWYIRSLSLFNIIINGSVLYDNVRKEKFIKSILWYYKIINVLLKEREKEKKKQKTTYPLYIQKCFNKLINTKQIITINLTTLDIQYPSFKKLFKWSSSCSYLPQFDDICNVFKTCNKIRIVNSNKRSVNKYLISSLFVPEFIIELNKINKINKLKKIEFWSFKFDSKSDKNINKNLFKSLLNNQQIIKNVQIQTGSDRVVKKWGLVYNIFIDLL